MKLPYYQVENITQAIAVSPQSKSFNLDLKKGYKYCIGIALIKRAGAGNKIRLGFSDNTKVILNPVNLDIFEMSTGDNANMQFFPTLIDADNNNIDIDLIFESIITAIDIDVVFLLSDEKPEISNYQFQHKRLSTPKTITTKHDFSGFDLNAAYKKIVGLMILPTEAYKSRFGVKNNAGTVLISDLDKSFFASKDVKPLERFFKADLVADGETIVMTYEPLETIVNDYFIDIIFLLEK